MVFLFRHAIAGRSKEGAEQGVVQDSLALYSLFRLYFLMMYYTNGLIHIVAQFSIHLLISHKLMNRVMWVSVRV